MGTVRCPFFCACVLFLCAVREVPGWIAFDKFLDMSVVRRCFRNQPLENITPKTLDDLLGGMARLRVNPISPLVSVPGRIGLVAKKEFLGPLRGKDLLCSRFHRHRFNKDSMTTLSTR